MRGPIAISGMACRFPDADSPAELWRNVLSQRRSFRRIPPGRLYSEDYVAADPQAPDRTYSDRAAVLDGWEFDRVRFRIAGSTFRSTDLAQWLALEVAAEALEDAGWRDGRHLPRDRTGVLVGNTLTGEFSRARLLRLRWPYVSRALASAWQEEGWSPEQLASILPRLEQRFKAPFAPIDEDALAGSLSNTIAGRVCNAFDLGGGGYTVDGACASSLLAVATACAALRAGDLDVALAGGVDLSLDPFELVGFAKAGALARTSMRVYDSRPEGFWPGEGCGFVVLEPLDRLLERRGRPYALIRGWGISSDGAGGITRPTLVGELRALRQAYARARIGIGAVDVFEGHGTGTAVGDQTELSALDAARRADGATRAAPVGSVKANIGHTKAAAGVAGLIKAALSVHERVIPPTTACEEPHALLCGKHRVLRPASAAEPWPHAGRGRAGVSGFGFGGINCHLVLEGASGRRARRLNPEAVRLSRSAQDAELFALSGPDVPTVRAAVERLRGVVDQLSLAELGDLAAALHSRLSGGTRASVRAAIVAATPEELAGGLDALVDTLAAGEPRVDPRRSIFLGLGSGSPPRVGLLFPGQASPTYANGGAVERRFAFLNDLSALMPAEAENAVDTSLAQPAIVGCEVIGLELLRRLRIEATLAVGHSVGELAALHWAGALDVRSLMALVRARGAAIARMGAADGAMASLAATAAEANALIDDEPGVVIAAYNGPRRTVISGPADAVDAVVARAAREGVAATRLSVSHAFHSPQVADARPALADALSGVEFAVPRRVVISTVTGAPIGADTDLRRLLLDQLTAPVRFASAAASGAEGVEILLEVGPGAVLTNLTREVTKIPVLPLDIGGRSLRPLLAAIGGLFALGGRPRLRELFAGRFNRPFDLDRPRAFLANPCELASAAAPPVPATVNDGQLGLPTLPSGIDPNEYVSSGRDVLSVLSALIAARAELPESSIDPRNRLLGDLHLTSIAVGELAAEAAQELGIAVPAAPTELADATVSDLVMALEASRVGGRSNEPPLPDGIAAWFRTFAPEWVARAAPPRAAVEHRWTVFAPDEHPLRAEITAAFAGGSGEAAVLACLPPERREVDARLMLEAAHAALRLRARRCAFVHTGGGAAGFAKSFHLEHPAIDVTVIDLPLDPAFLAKARGEAESARGFVEVRYESDGSRRVPILREWAPAVATPALGRDDVMLVSGGGKGIGCECALRLAAAVGSKVALLGRSDPAEDEQLRENLSRFAHAGLRHFYAIADVTDRASVDSALERVRRELGEVTAILHAAGANRPARVEDLDADALERTLAPKVTGLHNLLGAIEPERLRLLVTFGSIIGRTGLRGEAHYALANEWLECSMTDLQARLPACRCQNIEWTVWTGVGMGERLGTIAALAQSGVTPLPLDEGVRIFEQLVCSEASKPSVVVAGRFGSPPTVELGRGELPLLRFLEQVVVYYPGVELVVEARLSRGTDPYLADHVLDGTTLLPAVFGIEAMASVATALSGDMSRPTIEDARFERPVTMPDGGSRTIRLAGLVDSDGMVRVVLRSDETSFQTDHFSLRCRFAGGTPVGTDGASRPDSNLSSLGEDRPSASSLDPVRDLYGELLFHGPRFQRVLGYRQLEARSCVAEVETKRDDWFGSFLPQALVMGDPGAHDAVIHAIQACIPHARLVPVALERLAIHEPHDGLLRVEARERSSDGKRFVYDVSVCDATGRSCERWEGLSLQRVGDAPPRELWPPALLVPFLERRLEEETAQEGAHVTLIKQTGSRRQSSDAAIAEVCGDTVTVGRRADGRPEVSNFAVVSTAHLDRYTLAVAGNGPLGCDVEEAVPRPERRWVDLLGGTRLDLAQMIAAETGSDLDIEATRIWTAVECVKKAGLPISQPLTLARHARDGLVVLRGGDTTIATFVTHLPEIDRPVAIALALGGNRE